MSLPPEPLPSAAVWRFAGLVVDAPSSPTANVQWPAVTTTVGLISVPEQLNQPPGSA